jgi:hypothetical protein
MSVPLRTVDVTRANAATIPRRLRPHLARFSHRVRPAVHALMTRHPHFADLGGSFPALLFALAVPRYGVDVAGARALVIAGAPLRRIAAVADLPMWTRWLPPEAFVRPVPPLPDGDRFSREIANHVPPRSSAARWLDILAHGHAVADAPIALWAARARSGKPVDRAILRRVCLWAWCTRLDGALLPRRLIGRHWRPEMAWLLAAGLSGEWLEALTVHWLLADAAQRPATALAEPVRRIAGFAFVPLATLDAIAEEGAAMETCVLFHGRGMATSGTRLYGVRRNGVRVATLETGFDERDPFAVLLELRGPRNGDVADEVWRAARTFVLRHGGRKPAAPAPRACIDPRLWRERWRPYWRAKRRIPPGCR